MNTYELYGRYWTAVQMVHKTANAAWVTLTLPDFQDKALRTELRRARDNLVLVVAMLNTILDPPREIDE